MQEFNVKLPEGCSVPKSKEELLQLVQQLFDPAFPAYLDLASAIQYENQPKFGPSAITNIRFNVITFDHTTFKGRLRVLYDMQLTFGCEDFVKDHLDQHSYYNFDLLSPGLLRFISDQPEAPTTADEF